MVQNQTVFRVGDRAVYPAHGVVEVLGVITQDGRRCYSMRGGGVTITVPVENAAMRGVRPLIGPRDIEDVFSVLRDRAPLMPQPATWNRRFRAFMDKVRTGDACDVAEVFRDLARVKQRKVLSFGERRMFETVRKLLVEELAAVRGVEAAVVARELEEIFKEA